MDNKILTKITEQFDENISLYHDFGERLANLIKELLVEDGVSVHSVTFRSKDKKSFTRKINKSTASYKDLADITDVCGLRVITHFNSDVARASEIIKAEFEIDEINSIDKSAILDPDRFGYLSVHYVVSNNPSRNELREYKRFINLKAEIQIRSILQHAWAEIEHDLGYKSNREVPREIRRRFSRLAGLLELADQEFTTIRDELTAYSHEVIDLIRNKSAFVEVNAPSLQAFITESADIRALDKTISGTMGRTLVDPSIEACARTMNKLHYFNIMSIGTLEAEMQRNFDLIEKFSKAWLQQPNNRTETNSDSAFIDRGISIFYLCYLLALERNQFLPPHEYTTSFNLGFDPLQTANDLVAVAKSISKDNLNGRQETK